MVTQLALIGAGGKMGYRLSINLQNSDFVVKHVEVSEAGRERLKADLDISCCSIDEAIAGTEVVILAVPDTVIGSLAHCIVPTLPAGTIVVTLDPAAAFAGHLPERSDIVYFVTHPCHPDIFNNNTLMDADTDYFGGSQSAP